MTKENNNINNDEALTTSEDGYIVDPNSDFTSLDKDKLQSFIRQGCPGLISLSQDESKIMSMFSLYMSGKTYSEIAQQMKIKKPLVLYMSQKMRWYQKKNEYYQDLQSSIAEKTLASRVDSLNFLSKLIGFYHKFYGEKIDKYLETNDSAHMAQVDPKVLNQYFKAIEILEKILGNPNLNEVPTINISLLSNKDNTDAVFKDSKTGKAISSNEVGDILTKLIEYRNKVKNNPDQ